jgi:hypothetical protein
LGLFSASFSAAGEQKKIKQMIKYLSIIISLALLYSCRVAKPVTIVTKDSLVLKDTTIYKTVTRFLPGQQVVLEQKIPCPDAKLDTLIAVGNTRIKAQLKNGQLNVHCSADSLQHIIDSVIKIKSTEHYNTKTVQVPVEVARPFIPKWVWLLILANVLAGVWVFRAPLFKIIKRF